MLENILNLFQGQIDHHPSFYQYDQQNNNFYYFDTDKIWLEVNKDFFDQAILKDFHINSFLNYTDSILAIQKTYNENLKLILRDQTIENSIKYTIFNAFWRNYGFMAFTITKFPIYTMESDKIIQPKIQTYLYYPDQEAWRDQMLELVLCY